MALAALLASPAARAAEAWWPPIADPPTGRHDPGRWVWAELVTDDVGTAAEFYASVFGWTFETYGPAEDTDTYTLAFANGQPIAGMVFRKGDKGAPGRGALWLGLMSVADVDAAVRTARAGGGRVLFEPRVLGQRGRVALLTDPEGAMFGVIRSATGDPDDLAGDDGRWLWIELWADDPERMAAFYRPLGGYESKAGSIPGETRGLHLVSAGTPRAGVLRKVAKVPTTWVPYLKVSNVADTVARARNAGARIVLEPMAAHGTTVALMLDPTGAPFAVAEWNRNGSGSGAAGAAR